MSNRNYRKQQRLQNQASGQHTYRIEDASAFVMVKVWVQVVDANGIYAHDLHKGSISQASIGLAEGIRASLGEARATTRLVSDTDNLELVASLGIVDFIGLNVQSGDGGGQRRSESSDERGWNLI